MEATKILQDLAKGDVIRVIKTQSINEEVKDGKRGQEKLDNYKVLDNFQDIEQIVLVKDTVSSHDSRKKEVFLYKDLSDFTIYIVEKEEVYNGGSHRESESCSGIIGAIMGHSYAELFEDITENGVLKKKFIHIFCKRCGRIKK